MKTKKITLTIPVGLLEKLKEAAAKDRRSLSNLVALILSRAMEREEE